MAIIAFWRDGEKETGQTMSMMALSTYMATRQELKYRILNISTKFKSETLERSYWNTVKMDKLVKSIVQDDEQIGVESGVEGLIKLITSNRTTADTVANYTKIIYKDKLDVLPAPQTQIYEEYVKTAQMYPNVIKNANRTYDLVFVDVAKTLPEEQRKQILEIADVIVVNLSQRLAILNNFMKLRQENEFFRKNNIMLNIGRYDPHSKYNTKNITRFMNEKVEVHAIPYNTLFFEASAESSVPELFLRLINLDEEDRNYVFIKEISRFSKDLVYKMQELQMQM